MANPIELPVGISLGDTGGVHEGYMKQKTQEGFTFTINLSPARVSALLEGFIRLLKPAGFFFLELPADPENNPEEGYATYYLDGCTIPVLLAIVERYGELLINDGIVRFGFASHVTGDELYCEDYNVIHIYCSDAHAYEGLLQGLGLEEEKQLKTLWDCFGEDNPGEITSVTVDDETVFDIVENLREAGLYQAQ